MDKFSCVRAGKLRHRIDIEKLVSTGIVGDMGTPERNWVAVAQRVPAELKHVGGTETEQAQQTTGFQGLVCVIRYRMGVDSGMRVVNCSNREIMDIVAVKDLTGLRRELTLEVKAASPAEVR